MEKFVAFLRLTRPANIVTAIADILAGIAIAGYFTSDAEFQPIAYLILATVGLYGGGVVLNDVFDADLDRIERPERPIPRGVVSVVEAGTFGVFLLSSGIAAAFLVSSSSGTLAFIIAVAAVVYDKWGKHHSFLGPVNMGLCRGLNLLLGISILPDQIGHFWIVGLVPLIYIAAVTMVSRGEVHGGSRRTLLAAGILYGTAILAILFAGIRNKEVLATGIFTVAWVYMIFTPLIRASRNPQGPLIGKAVRAGVIALILMNAAWAAAFGFPVVALVIASLLPISILLARMFAVT